MKHIEGRIRSTSSGVGPIWLANLNCTGSEYSIFKCPHSLTTSDCDHSQDTGIECYKYTGKIDKLKNILC